MKQISLIIFGIILAIFLIGNLASGISCIKTQENCKDLAINTVGKIFTIDRNIKNDVAFLVAAEPQTITTDLAIPQIRSWAILDIFVNIFMLINIYAIGFALSLWMSGRDQKQPLLHILIFIMLTSTFYLSQALFGKFILGTEIIPFEGLFALVTNLGAFL